MGPFKLNKPVFEKDEPAGGGSPAPKTDDGAGADDSKKAGDDQQTKSEKTFTQKDVDQIVKDRLEREHKKQEEATLKAKEDAEKAALQEQGKHKELADKATKDAEQARAAKEAAEAALKTERIRFAVLTKAMQMNFADAEDAIKMSNFSDLEFDEAGKPNAEMIGKKLDELVKAKPYLVKTDGNTPNYGTPKKKEFKPNSPKDEKRPGVPIPKF